MTAPRAETPFEVFSARAREDWMYAARETSPAAHPYEIGMKVAAILHATVESCGAGWKYGIYQTIKRSKASRRMNGIGLVAVSYGECFLLSNIRRNSLGSNENRDRTEKLTEIGTANHNLLVGRV